MADDAPPVTARRGSEDEVNDYKVADKKTVAELLSTEGKESEDEALQRYKANLLGAAAEGGGASTDPRRVVVTELAVLIDGHDPIVVDEAAIAKGGATIQLKEGCSYKTQCARLHARPRPRHTHRTTRAASKVFTGRARAQAEIPRAERDHLRLEVPERGLEDGERRQS